jgi:hypothetical protein
LTERADPVCLEDVEAKTSQSGEYPGIGPDTRAVFAERDVAAVVGCRFDRPMRADRLGRAAGSYWLVREVEGGFAGAAQQSVAAVAGVDDTLDTDDGLGVALPVAVVEFAPRLEDADGAGFIAVASLVMAMVRAERRRHGGEVDDILVQGWLVALDLNDQADAGLLGDVEGFFDSVSHRV